MWLLGLQALIDEPGLAKELIPVGNQRIDFFQDFVDTAGIAGHLRRQDPSHQVVAVADQLVRLIFFEVARHECERRPLPFQGSILFNHLAQILPVPG